MRNLIKIFSICMVFFMTSCKENKSNSSADTQKDAPIVEANDIDKIEPPHWWVGFKKDSLQLLVKHPNIGTTTPEISYEGVNLVDFHKADSPNYLFLDLKVSESAEAGKFNIKFKGKDGEELVQTYQLKTRQKSAEDYVGFDSSDAIYLITPDRFANANPDNDSFDNLNEKGIDRLDDYARHGGDINGISLNLDYIKDMGFTAIWPGPVLINDMFSGSYHGYAITDYYKVDPRFGTTEDYIKLANIANDEGIKLIMDQVANHCGLEHWWMKDLPFKDWVNYQDHYIENQDNWNRETVIMSNHSRTVNQDKYASEIDKEELSKGWFVPNMPDLNQENPFMANYIIQNSIWWIETLGLGGIRQDTYPYPNKQFMSDWAGAIMTEYPNFNIVGEEWSTNPLLIAYWQDGHENTDGYESNLPSTMDFAMQEKVVSGLNNEETWGTGLKEIYTALANDFSYSNPEHILVFPDNHDMSRIFTQLKGDIPNTKMALSYMLMLPRIPQIYYGTEILMSDFDNPGDHGLIRTDFPGGWKGDKVNAFTGEGLSADQRDMQSFLKTILNYRKTSEAIQHGETVHFAPKNGVYLLARKTSDEIVVHIMNKNETPIEMDLIRFKELNLNGKMFKNLISGESMVWKDVLKLNKKGSTILTTKF